MHIPDLVAPIRAACVACDRRTALEQQLLCGSCEAGLDADLRAIAAGYPLLTPEPGVAPLRAGLTHRAPGPRSPAVDDVLVLTDPRPAAWDPDGAETRASSLVGLVRHWVDELVIMGLVDERDLRFRAFVTGAHGVIEVHRGRAVPAHALLLADRVPTLARHWSVGELARQCAAQVGHLRRALGEDVRMVVLGACPLPDVADPLAVLEHARLVDELGGIPAAVALPQLSIPTCGGRLRSQGWGHPARCSSCGMRWAGERALRELGAMLGGAMLDMPGMVRYFAMDGREATLRKWASRDGWRRERMTSGRTLYSLDDARRSWWAAFERDRAVDEQPPPAAPSAVASLAPVVPLPRPALDELLVAA